MQSELECIELLKGATNLMPGHLAYHGHLLGLDEGDHLSWAAGVLLSEAALMMMLSSRVVSQLTCFRLLRRHTYSAAVWRRACWTLCHPRMRVR